MDAKIINPFLSATLDIFGSMFSIEAKPGKPYLLGRELMHRWDLSGILGVTGDYSGIVGFRLTRILADKMLQRSGIFTESEKERQELLYEMVGEMTNIIAGNASSLIDHVSIEISPPAVIMGEHHEIAWPRAIPVICIPFSSATGPFEVAVCFKSNLS